MDQVSRRHEGDLQGRLVTIDRVEELPVTVVVDEQGAELASTQHTAWMLVNLLSRLKRIVKQVGLVCPPAPLAGRVAPLAHRERELSSAILAGGAAIGAVPVTPGSIGGIVLTVGPGNRDERFRVYGEGWWGGLSGQGIIGPGVSDLPFGPYVAACIAAGEVFKQARMIPGSYEKVSSSFFSLWCYKQDSRPVHGGPAGVHGLDLDVALAGVGAVGSTWVHAMWACRGVTGRVLLADNDPKGVDATNLNRYPLFGTASVGRPKASEAARLVFDSGLTWAPIDAALQDQRDLPPLVISAVDRNRPRSAIQDRYPPRILGASTLELRAEVMRCGPPGVGPCLRCYNPPEVLPSDDEIRERLRRKDDTEIAALASQAGIPRADAAEWIRSGGCGESGERLLHFIRRTEDEPEDWAVGFVSVLAGTMLAAETIKEHLGVEVPLNGVLQRAVYQFENPAAATNRAGPFLRDPTCPKCDPSTDATSVWKRRYETLKPSR